MSSLKKAKITVMNLWYEFLMSDFFIQILRINDNQIINQNGNPVKIYLGSKSIYSVQKKIVSLESKFGFLSSV